MESSGDSLALAIRDEINDLLTKGYDDWIDEGFTDEEADKIENQIGQDISLFITLFESSYGILEQKVKDLKEVADSLERVHFGTTVGSLTGGVVSAAGGVTSLVGLAMAPFTLGASLIVTGMGLGVAAVGGLTSGVSNITNMVNESVNRKNIEGIIKDYTDKMEPITKCLGELSENLETLQKLRSIKEKSKVDSTQNVANMMQVGTRLGRVLWGAPEVVRLVQVASLGKVAAQASKAVQVAWVFTGALSGLFIALDVYFIAKDAKEIHNMRGNNTDSTKEVESAAVKFIKEIRETAMQLEQGLDELKAVKEDFDEGRPQ